MMSNNVFAALTRGASLHKCSDSLATPLLRRRQEQRHQREQHDAGNRGCDSTPKKKRASKAEEDAADPDSIRQQHSISVKGLEEAPPPFRTFSDELPPQEEATYEKETASECQSTIKESFRRLPAWLVTRLETLGYKAPTPIQMQAIPLLLKGYHVLASAPTGSGKTLAFLLPLIACLKAPRAAFGRLVVLSPTRELARQSLRVFEKLTEGTGFRAAFPQSHAGGRYGAADAVFATPLSLLTLLKEKRLSLADCQHLVLDEADRLLDHGQVFAGGKGIKFSIRFSPQVDAILSELKSASGEKRLHICLFSATLPPSVVLLAESIAFGAVHLAVGRASAAAPQVEQELVFCSTEAGKLWALKSLRVERRLIPPCLIFVETQERASELLKEMIGEGMSVDLLHASKSKQQRDATVDAFRTGEIWFLICTDLMARGVDFKGVALVINFDLPQSTAVYIHRIGRTGRAGREGKALTFFTLDDVPRLRPIVQVMRKSPNSKIPSFLKSKLTRNLRVKGQKNRRGLQQLNGKGGVRRPRKPIRPVARASILKAKRRSWAIAASLAKKRREQSGSEDTSHQMPLSEASISGRKTASGDRRGKKRDKVGPSSDDINPSSKKPTSRSSKVTKRKGSPAGGAPAAKRNAMHS